MGNINAAQTNLEVTVADPGFISELALLAEAVEFASDAAVVTDSRGQIHAVNPAFTQLTGYTLDEISGSTLPAINSGRSLESVYAGLTQAVQIGQAWHGELIDHKKNGPLFKAQIHIVPIHGSSGALIGFVTYQREITSVPVAQPSREHEANFRDLFDHALEGIFQVSIDGRPLAVNRAMARIHGYDSPEDFLASVRVMTDSIWVDASERDLFLSQLQQFGKVEGFECRVRHKDGSSIWVSINIRTVHDPDGSVAYFAGFIQDISERRKTEAAYAESKTRFQRFFEQNGLTMLIVEPGTGKIYDANQAAADFYGYSRDELARMSVTQFNTLPPDQIYAEHQRALSEDRARFEFRSRVANGQIRDVEVYTSPIEIDGKMLLFSVVHDVTDRKHTERRLRESEERFRTTFDQAAVGMVHVALDGTILRCNQRYAQITGYSRDELVGMSITQIIPPEDHEEARAVDRKMETREADSFSAERRHLRKDGSTTWIKVTVSVLRDAAGNPLHYISLIEDISERKIAEDRLVEAMRALHRSEDRYHAAFETTLDAITISELKGKFIDVNQPFIDMLGYSREELLGHNSFELGIWEDPAQRDQMLKILEAQGNYRDFEVKLRKKNGQSFWAKLSVSMIHLKGEPCILAMIRDISAEKEAAELLLQANEALRHSEARYRAAFEASADSININRLSDGAYVECNQAFLDIFGYRREEVLGRNAQELGIWAHHDDRQAILDRVESQGNCREYECQFRKRSGELFWGRLSASPVEVDGVPCLLTVGRDISSTKTAEDEIRSLAFYDQLTQLPNRRLLQDRLKKALAASARHHQAGAVLFIDLDNFKTLNDTLGHQTGDQLLQEVSARLTACTRSSDTVARLGGDEFVVVLEDLGLNLEDAATLGKTVAEKILAAIHRPYHLGDHECLSTCSIGIAIFGATHVSMDDIMQQADIAMYHSKGAGRNTVRFFAPELQAAVNVRASTENDLRHAIANNQFVLFYQPQVENDRIIGAETLLRWQHPRRGLLSPNEFISLAEETGLILPLGEWALESAFKQSAAWEEHPAMSRLTLAVNISARQFRQPEFVNHVLNVLYRTGANPQKIRMELTESMLVDNLDDVVAKMTLLIAHGFRFALDDFGTGYSSLAYLKRLPLDQLKIDRIFVRDLLVDNGSGAIAETIVSLGKAMGLPVVAEGIENEQQRAFLANLGCHAFQGYLFGRPMPIADFEQLF